MRQLTMPNWRDRVIRYRGEPIIGLRRREFGQQRRQRSCGHCRAVHHDLAAANLFDGLDGLRWGHRPMQTLLITAEK